MIICCNTKYMCSKHVSTQLWHHINESTAMGSVSNNVIKLTDNSGNLNHLGKCVSSGLLIFRGKKSKILRDFQGQIRGKIGRFRGIFAGKKSKFAEKLADFVGFSREKVKIRGKIRRFRGRKVKIRRKIDRFRGILAEKSQISKDFQGQIHRKIGRFHGETSPRNNQ